MRTIPFFQTPGRCERPAASRSPVALGLPSSVRTTHAVRAGLVTLLGGWLVVALLLSPYWAAQTNFPGHGHPDGTSAHTHTLQAVFGPALLGAASVVLALALRPGRFLPLRPADWLEPAPPVSAHGSRAPPRPV